MTLHLPYPRRNMSWKGPAKLCYLHHPSRGPQKHPWLLPTVECGGCYLAPDFPCNWCSAKMAASSGTAATSPHSYCPNDGLLSQGVLWASAELIRSGAKSPFRSLGTRQRDSPLRLARLFINSLSRARPFTAACVHATGTVQES